MNYPGGPSNVSGQRGMTTVHAHLRLGRPVRTHTRRITRATRLYRIDVPRMEPLDWMTDPNWKFGVTPPTAADLRRAHDARMSLAIHAAFQKVRLPSTLDKVSESVLRGRVHWFTPAGWKKFGLRSYRAVRRQGFAPKIRHARGGKRLDRWQALK